MSAEHLVLQMQEIQRRDQARLAADLHGLERFGFEWSNLINAYYDKYPQRTAIDDHGWERFIRGVHRMPDSTIGQIASALDTLALQWPMLIHGDRHANIWITSAGKVACWALIHAYDMRLNAYQRANFIQYFTDTSHNEPYPASRPWSFMDIVRGMVECMTPVTVIASRECGDDTQAAKKIAVFVLDHLEESATNNVEEARV